MGKHLQNPVNHLILNMPTQNVFHCSRVEIGMLGYVTMTITPPKEKQRKNLTTMKCRANISSIYYWDSRDAANLFGLNYDEAENVVDGLKDIIRLLTGGFTDWKKGV